MAKYSYEYIGRKLYELIGEEHIYFDFSSYEYEDDIPHIIILGKRYNVQSASVNDCGKALLLEIDSEDAVAITEVRVSLSSNEKELDEANIYGVLSDIYYETMESWAIGDFEKDFLASW